MTNDRLSLNCGKVTKIKRKDKIVPYLANKLLYSVCHGSMKRID